ncbi:MAG: DUF4392 domain-containing protein [Candidatus Pelagadaptatus aseana]|uniref:DUF4392 domain-containing protein n=1 Tax=Candidatus Pelagadaptatus aseana TaxID=3120508 RepID=UPI0039B324A6
MTRSLHSSEAQQLSKTIEDMLVERNLRGMKTIQPALTAGYYGRAAEMIQRACEQQGTILIGTGFPVTDTFETDGPVGAIALYNALQTLGAKPVLVCGPPLCTELVDDYRIEPLLVGPHAGQDEEARQALRRWKPSLIISIERPGKARDGNYYNMRGEDISARAACFDSFMEQALCPTIAIGDGGNEIGMGNIHETLQSLNIVPSSTTCTELVIADVSNWGALGLIALLSWHSDRDLLSDIDPMAILQYLSQKGSVDGVTRLNELTEDGLPASEGIELIGRLKHLVS